jgi:hypothetical protein
MTITRNKTTAATTAIIIIIMGRMILFFVHLLLCTKAVGANSNNYRDIMYTYVTMGYSTYYQLSKHGSNSELVFATNNNNTIISNVSLYGSYEDSALFRLMLPMKNVSLCYGDMAMISNYNDEYNLDDIGLLLDQFDIN